MNFLLFFLAASVFSAFWAIMVILFGPSEREQPEQLPAVMIIEPGELPQKWLW